MDPKSSFSYPTMFMENYFQLSLAFCQHFLNDLFAIVGSQEAVIVCFEAAKAL